MSTPEIISESFRVHFYKETGMEPRDFVKVDNAEYIWRSDPAGTLYIYNKEYHATFTTAVIKDQRIAAYPQGTWMWVEVLETITEVEDETPADSGSAIALA
jgi:hypothetical protein